MDLILCHTTADFDALGAAVGLTLLVPGAKLVLSGGCHPTVRDFLALHRDEYAVIERRAVRKSEIRSLIVVDAQLRDRLGAAAEWLDLPQLERVEIYDHHLGSESDIAATQVHLAAVGAVTTLVVEELQSQGISLTPAAATVMALGIHADTGSLTFETATARDAIALAWLMQQGANLRSIAAYTDSGLSPQLQELLTTALEQLESQTVSGYTVSWVMLKTESHVPGLSSLASQILELTESNALLLAASHPLGNGEEQRVSVIGRSRIPGTNLNDLFADFGGGGHAQAASLSLRGVNPAETLNQLVEQLTAQIPHPATAREIMSSPVRTIRPETTIGEAQRILLRYGHSGLSVVDATDNLVGIISRRDLDIALHHGFSHAPVKGYMTTNLKTITPNTTLPEIQSLMVTYDIGRLPVLASGQLVGIVTRTDVLRELHQSDGRRQMADGRRQTEDTEPPPVALLNLLRDRLAPQFWELLTQAATAAKNRGWHLYLVGGAVRDLLLAKPGEENLVIPDIDLVVDGFHQTAAVGAGVELARELQQLYATAHLEVHGAFQTAALSWHKDPILDSLLVDIATARTEFYPYPAANPEVESSSIRQDLYRRDFTINALALRLTPPRAGELLDFFGGLLDLSAQQIRVLHANSFIEDPTRIYRAVRFAVRLGFTIEPQTIEYIRYAIASGVYYQPAATNQVRPALQTRLKAELRYILQAPYWKPALQLLADLDALKCLHPTLEMDRSLWRQLHLLQRCLQQFDSQQLTPWLLRLELIIAHLAPEYRAQVADNLQLPDDSIKRLKTLAQAQTQVITNLPGCQLPSQVVQLLRLYDLPTLILIALTSPRSIRRQIWRYGTNWANVQPLLNGHDLKALGYQPGPQYRQILDRILAATLDGEISDRAAAEEFVLANYPRS